MGRGQVSHKGKQLVRRIERQTAQALRDQTVRKGFSKADGGSEHVGTLAAQTLMLVHEQKTDEKGVERFRVAFSGKTGWVKGTDAEGPLLDICVEPEPEPDGEGVRWRRSLWSLA